MSTGGADDISHEPKDTTAGKRLVALVGSMTPTDRPDTTTVRRSSHQYIEADCI